MTGLPGSARRPSAGKATFLVLLAAALGVGGAVAQTTAEPPPFSPMRYDEDYSYLADPSRRTGAWWERLKFLPFDSAGRYWLSIGDEVRFRYERYWANNFGSAKRPDEDYLRYRQLPYLGLHAGQDVTVFAQMQIAFAVRDAAVKNPILDQTGFDILQAFVEWRALQAGDLQLSLRGGRQVLLFGSGRLINAGPNIRTSFDGADVQLKGGGWHADAFYVRPVKPGLDFFDDRADGGRQVWALYFSRPFPEMGPAAALDLYYFGYENDAATFNQGKGVEHRHTFGARHAGAAGPVKWDVEGGIQLGNFAGKDILAWYLATDEIYTYTRYALTPWVGLRVAVMSGDGDPRDGKLGTFNPMFAQGGYFGENGVLGPFNLILIRTTLGLDFGAGVSLAAGTTVYWRASLADGIYDLGGGVLRPSDASGTRLVGPQFDAALSWAPERNLNFALAYSLLIPGGFVADTGPSWTVHFVGGHAMFRY